MPHSSMFPLRQQLSDGAFSVPGRHGAGGVPPGAAILAMNPRNVRGRWTGLKVNLVRQSFRSVGDNGCMLRLMTIGVIDAVRYCPRCRLGLAVLAHQRARQ